MRRSTTSVTTVATINSATGNQIIFLLSSTLITHLICVPSPPAVHFPAETHGIITN